MKNEEQKAVIQTESGLNEQNALSEALLGASVVLAFIVLVVFGIVIFRGLRRFCRFLNKPLTGSSDPTWW